ncbi:MAG: outer membrane beta-barrel protein, partial [Gemmatimonadales bacterium]|nr:outer membrane beta-barrel protein [Candidatus Palauibacter ramosifaciens]
SMSRSSSASRNSPSHAPCPASSPRRRTRISAASRASSSMASGGISSLSATARSEVVSNSVSCLIPIRRGTRRKNLPPSSGRTAPTEPTGTPSATLRRIMNGSRKTNPPETFLPMTHIDNCRPAAVTGLLLGLGCLAAAPSAIRAQAPTGPGPGYLSVGVAAVLPADVRFVDGDDAGEAALYGDDQSDSGTLAAGLEYRLAAGYRFGAFRAEVELGVTGRFAYEGQSNYAGGGPVQPTEARMTARRLLLSGFYEFGAPGAPGALQPWVGAGLGANRYHLTDYIQRFPNPDDPSGRLRRGPDGEVPYTSLPPGTGYGFAWVLAAGLTVPLGADMQLDFAYRYTDAGRIGTSVGEAEVVRYNEDGNRGLRRIIINSTAADLRLHSLTATLRWLP